MISATTLRSTTETTNTNNITNTSTKNYFIIITSKRLCLLLMHTTFRLICSVPMPYIFFLEITSAPYMSFSRFNAFKSSPLDILTIKLPKATRGSLQLLRSNILALTKTTFVKPLSFLSALKSFSETHRVLSPFRWAKMS